MKVWLDVCSSKDRTPLLILDEETVDHGCYIKNILPVALKYGNEAFDNNWIFQQDGASPYRDHLMQGWRLDSFASFIGKDRWPPNSPALNPLDGCIWDELINIIDWNKVRSKTGDTDRAIKIVGSEISLWLKVALVGLIDCIAYLKTTEIIYVNKNHTICRSLDEEYFYK